MLEVLVLFLATVLGRSSSPTDDKPPPPTPPSTDTPLCSTKYMSPNGIAVNTTDGDGNDRCYSLVTPPSTLEKLPVLFYFHGSGGNAAACGKARDANDNNSLEMLA